MGTAIDGLDFFFILHLETNCKTMMLFMLGVKKLCIYLCVCMGVNKHNETEGHKHMLKRSYLNNIQNFVKIQTIELKNIPSLI